MMNDEKKPYIEVSAVSNAERNKRKREIGLAVIAILIIFIFTWFLKGLTRIDSFTFIAVANLILILLGVIFFLVVRNIAKLMLDRKRRVFGSKIRTKLVLIFLGLTLIPIVIMFALSFKFIQISMNYWLKEQTSNSMEQAQQLGKTYYNILDERLRVSAEYLVRDIKTNNLMQNDSLNEYINNKKQEHGFSFLGIVNRYHNKKIIWLGDVSEAISKEIQLNIQNALLTKNYTFSVVEDFNKEILLGVIPISNLNYLVLGESIPAGIKNKLIQIDSGVSDYQELRKARIQLRNILYLSLGATTALMLLGSSWFGMKIAKELITPVQALARATERIATGDLSVRLIDNSSDEIGKLIRAFNDMTDDLESSRKVLTRVNTKLSNQNKELALHSQYVQTVLDNITAGVISIGSDEKIKTINAAGEKILGITSKQIIGKNLTEIMPERYFSLVSDLRGQFKAAPGSQWQRQIELTVDGQQVRLLITVVVLKLLGSANNGLVAVFEDITELERVQRMAAWKEVAKRIAHEIKNPLTPIKLSAQRLSKKYGVMINDPSFIQSTDLIVRQVNHLQDLVRDFSAFAKLPEIKLTKGNIVSEIEKIIDDFRQTHSKIKWTFESENIPEIYFDKDGINNIFMNLFLNAVDALLETKQPQVVIVVSHIIKRGVVKIEVRDNGTGLPFSEQTRIFEPYFTSKENGTGLGLTIVKSVIRDHYGYIRVGSNMAGGLSIFIELPIGRA